MADYVNVGAWKLEGDQGEVRVRMRTKTELRNLLRYMPWTVEFDQTSMFTEGPTDLTVSDIRPGMVLTVVGPDPYTNRKWYASVRVDKEGRVVVT